MHRLISGPRPRTLTFNTLFPCGTVIQTHHLSTTSTKPPSTTTTKSTKKTPTLRPLPIKHSRLISPPAASPTILTSLTEELLKSSVGSWYTISERPIPPSLLKWQHANDVSDVWSQKVEFAIRGHSRLIDGSLLHEPAQSDSEDAGVEMSTSERIDTMTQLVKRIEEEGEAYRAVQIEGIDQYLEKRAELKKAMEELKPPSVDVSQYEEIKKRARGEPLTPSPSDDDLDLGDDDDTTDDPTKRNLFIKRHCGAPPGVTTPMIDLTLDALSLNPDADALARARELHNLAVLRHIKDGGYNNTNPKTIPTLVTFNSIIRTAANLEWDGRDERLRDAALDAAFFTYDKMYRSDVLDRNVATYVYILRVLKKFIPQSRTRGNMCAAMIGMAQHDKVLTKEIVAELEGNGNEGAPDYDAFCQMLRGYDEIPLKNRKFAKKRRYRIGENRY